MLGFFICNRKIEIEDTVDDYSVSEILKNKKFIIKRQTLKKFYNDKVFAEDDEYIVVIEGLVLNNQKLFAEYGANSMFDLVKKMYSKDGETFFRKFRGPFSGALYDKVKGKWYVFTNQTGDNAVFYYHDGSTFMIGNNVNDLIKGAMTMGLSLTFDYQGAYQIMTYGFMANDATYANEIKRLRGGMYLEYSCSETKLHEYWRFCKNPSRFEGYSDDKLVREIDKAFKNAINLEYKKDLEYDFNHLTDISGGLDSRMNMWVAHSLGYNHLQLITYCKANYLDEIIAKEIAEYWKDELLVKPLDDASYLYDIDKIVELNGGLSLYSGITGGLRLLESLNMHKYGVEHTGMIGDVVIGSFCSSEEDNENKMPSGMYSRKLIHRLDLDSIENSTKYGDHELFLLYARALQGAANTFLIRRHFTEPVSPFMDPDFLQLCLDIPLEKRAKHKLYKKWITTMHSDAARFRWEKNGSKITVNPGIAFLKKCILRGPAIVLQIAGKPNSIKNNMNPLDFFISRNEKIRRMMDDYFAESLSSMPINLETEFVSDIRVLYDTGSAFEKTMALTVLSAIKLYFGGQDGKTD